MEKGRKKKKTMLEEIFCCHNFFITYTWEKNWKEGVSGRV